MIEKIQIFVALCDDGVDVWRPVQAILLANGTYRIIDQPYDCDIETWEFEPGDEVWCEFIPAEKGQILAATRKA